MNGERILVVDDEPGVRTALNGILADEGFRVVCAASGEEGVEEFARQSFDAVLLDVWLPGIDGMETLQRFRELRSDTEVVMISGHGTIDTAVRATKLGAFDFVEKPLSLEKTLLVLRNALQKRRLKQRNRRLLEQLSRDTEIVGRSPAVERLRREIEIAAATDAPVLLVGERGSGRETVARRIHAAGRSADGPFVEVPAGALDVRAAREALFGGAGPPARLELARGGTLYLENAEFLDPELQRRLAERLADPSRSDNPARVIVSTTVESGSVEPALVQAVDVVRIRIPALRERREDIPLHAERLMRELAREYGRPAKRLGAEALMVLKSYAWPGNVQELENLVERLLLFAPGEVVEVGDLPETLGGARPPYEDLYRDFVTLEEGQAVFERYYVRRVMNTEGGDRDAAARRLAIPREVLDEKLARS